MKFLIRDIEVPESEKIEKLRSTINYNRSFYLYTLRKIHYFVFIKFLKQIAKMVHFDHFGNCSVNTRTTDD